MVFVDEIAERREIMEGHKGESVSVYDAALGFCFGVVVPGGSESYSLWTKDGASLLFYADLEKLAVAC
tara:strand:+ start:275 stop:478 length:204 start_codon:yes stop_codon:yes gene_type:complete